MWSLIVAIVIGFIAGLIARAIHPGDDKAGFIMTTLLGIQFKASALDILQMTKRKLRLKTKFCQNLFNLFSWIGTHDFKTIRENNCWGTLNI